MATTIAVSQETRRRLMRLKLEEEAKSMDELLQRLVVSYQRARLQESSRSFRSMMEEKGLRLGDLIGDDAAKDLME